MGEIWIADAGPVILLAKAGYLSLMEQLAEEIWLPSPVCGEIRRGPRADPARLVLAAGWGRRLEVSYIPVAIRRQIALGRGEQAVLTLAGKYENCRAVLDDDAARKTADRLKIPEIGTLGLIVRAKQQEIIPAAAPVLAAIQSVGGYLNPALVVTTLAAIGETWP